MAAIALWDDKHNDAAVLVIAGVIMLLVIDFLLGVRLKRHERWEAMNVEQNRELTHSAVENALSATKEMSSRMIVAMESYAGSASGLERDLREMRYRLQEIEAEMKKMQIEVADLLKRNHQALGIAPRQKEK